MKKQRVETPTHRSWRKMKERCTNPNCRQWPWYGALGINFCERWRSFENFLADMGERPVGTTLDRIDGTKDYEPGNCRWATALEQSRNQRHNLYVEYQGRRVFLRELCEEMGRPWGRVYQRLRSGWTIEEALSETTHQKLAVKRGEPLCRAKLTADQVLTLRTAPRRRGGKGDRGGIKTMQQWADEFGVSLGCVLKAARGETHSHIKAAACSPDAVGARPATSHDTQSAEAGNNPFPQERVGGSRHSLAAGGEG